MEAEEAQERGEIIKEQHPELEGIIDELIDKSQIQEEVSPLSVFDEQKTN